MSGRQAKAAVTADHITQKKQLVPLMLLLLHHLLLLGLFHKQRDDPFGMCVAMCRAAEDWGTAKRRRCG
jgi:hypothetical protein